MPTADDPLWVVTDVLVADVDADGRADLLTSAQYAMSVTAKEGRVKVQRQTAPGRFATPETYVVGTYPWHLRLADLDRDGAPDLLVTGTEDVSVSWLRQDAANRGRFLAPVTLTSGFSTLDVVACDLDGDGRLDIAAPDGKRASARLVIVKQAAGTATAFGPATSIALPDGFGGDALACADVDGDGRNDLAAWIGSAIVSSATLGTGRLGYLLQRADGSFGPFVDVATRTGLNGARLHAMDYFGDGTTALVAFLTAQEGSVKPEILVAGPEPASGAYTRFPFGVLTGIRGVDDAAFADLDADGRVDAALAGFFPVGSAPLAPTSTESRVNTFRQVGDGSLQLADVISMPFSVSRIAAGDVDGDGRDDLAVYGGKDQLRVMLQSKSLPGRFDTVLDLR